MSNKQKILIDTDPGVDDAMAVFFACLHPDLDVVGLTSVFGNVTAEIATRNSIVLVERAGQGTIPVAMGASVPLVQKPNPVSDFVHGVDGFGDMPAQEAKGTVHSEAAPAFICRLIHENPHEIALCPIGPLTNIAAALKLDPTIAGLVKDVVIMGGSFAAGGNVSNCAEANIWNDPHAADIVFAADWPVTMIGLDVTQKVICTPEDFKELAKAAPVMGGFLDEAAQFYMKFYKDNVDVRGCYMHDPAAVVATLRPDLFTIENHRIEVKVEGMEIGRTAPSTDTARRKMNITVDIDADAVKSMFMETIKSGF